jgi:hypothetical protein
MNLLLVIISASPAVFADVLIFMYTRLSFFHPVAPPQKIEAPLGKACFFFQDMIDGYAALKRTVSFLTAPENIEPFVLINHDWFVVSSS